MLKTCTKCGQVKEAKDGFFRCSRFPTTSLAGWQQPCKNCTSSSSIRGRQIRERNYSRFYLDFTIADYDWLLAEQHGKCALCGILTKYTLHVDHDHNQCGHQQIFAPDQRRAQGCRQCIRGLLCRFCNRIRLPWVERDLEMQGPKIQAYLANRPLLRRVFISEWGPRPS